MRKLLAIVALLVAGCSSPNPPPASPPADQSGRWVQVFRDDFDGSSLSTANWRYDLGTCYPGCPAPNWGTGEVARHTDSTSNVSLDGSGHLAITPRLSKGEWTSGRIESVRSDFAAPKGGTLRVEGVLRLPNVDGKNGAGYWPAFWMMGAPIRDSGYTGWPQWGELDLMEQVNGRPGIYSAVHMGSLDKPVDVGSDEYACVGCSAGFHAYAMELDEFEVRFYLDGTMHHQVKRDQVGEQVWQDATGHGFFMILNVAIGGMFPKGPTKSTVDGKPMLVDYVAVYIRSN